MKNILRILGIVVHPLLPSCRLHYLLYLRNRKRLATLPHQTELVLLLLLLALSSIIVRTTDPLRRLPAFRSTLALASERLSAGDGGHLFLLEEGVL